MCNFKETVAFVFIANCAGDIQPRRIRSNDCIAALEQQLLRDGQGFAGFSVACDLNQQHLSRRETLHLTQEGRTVWRAEEHAPLAFYGAVGAGAIDGAGQGCIACDQKIVECSIDHQGRGFTPVDVIENDLSALHGASSL